MSVTTTRSFACATQLFTILTAATWPAHPTVGGTPTVVLGGLVGGEAGREVVAVQGTPPGKPTIDFATLGQVGHDEHFGLRVFIGTYIPGQAKTKPADNPNGVDVLARITALTAVVETTVRDQTTGKPAGGFNTLGFQVPWWRVARIDWALALGPEGIVGHAEIDIAFFARI